METGRAPMVGLVALEPGRGRGGGGSPATTTTPVLALLTEDWRGLEMREVLAPPAQVLAASLAWRTVR